MRSRRRGSGLVLVGWLWADLLLALFAIFAVANTFAAPRPAPRAIASPSLAPSPVPSATPSPTPSPTATASVAGIDPRPLEISVRADAGVLLSTDASAIAAEQDRLAEQIRTKLGAQAARHVALALAFGHHLDPLQGERIASVGTARLPQTLPAFRDAVFRPYHDIGADAGVIDLVLYFMQ